MPLSPVVDVLFAHRIYVVFAPFIVIRLLSCLVHIYRGRQSVDLGVLAFLAADSAQVGNTKRYFLSGRYGSVRADERPFMFSPPLGSLPWPRPQ